MKMSVEVKGMVEDGRWIENKRKAWVSRVAGQCLSKTGPWDERLRWAKELAKGMTDLMNFEEEVVNLIVREVDRKRGVRTRVERAKWIRADRPRTPRHIRRKKVMLAEFYGVEDTRKFKESQGQGFQDPDEALRAEGLLEMFEQKGAGSEGVETGETEGKG